ncbi:MAG: helix-turn-helix domain-containing protein [Solirubrobacteraceae bacterium]
MPPQRKSQPRNLELAALGKAIEARMAEQGLRQKSLADASGIDIRRIGDYIRGQYNPSLANLKRLCKGLDLSVDELMERAGKLEGELSES